MKPVRVRSSMLIEPASSRENQSGVRELRVKIHVNYHLRLHALKLLRGKPMHEVIAEALDNYFEHVVKVREEERQGGETTSQTIAQ